MATITTMVTGIMITITTMATDTIITMTMTMTMMTGIITTITTMATITTIIIIIMMVPISMTSISAPVPPACMWKVFRRRVSSRSRPAF